MLYNTNPIICTLGELLDRVKKDRSVVRVVEMQSQIGYVSRKIVSPEEWEETPIYVAGGKRKGQLYYLSPRVDTTRYCWRCYLDVTVADINKYHMDIMRCEQ
nr:MAG TPA: hypothetical protein [Caudoviricetes sp.]